MRQIILLLSFAIILSSCKNNNENNITVYREADEGLQRSIRAAFSSSLITYHELEYKLNNNETMVAAFEWQPVGMEIKKLSDSMALYLQMLRSELISETGIKEKDIKEGKWETNLSVTDHVFSSHERGKELFERMIKFKQGLLAIHPLMKDKLGNRITVFSIESDSGITDPIKFTKTFFSNIPAIAASVMLSKFENNVRIVENRLAMFCLGQIPTNGWNLDKPIPLGTQSSTYLRPGQELEINVSIGNYMEPYKLKAPLKAGDYMIPVKIEFYTPEGKKETIKKYLSYTVAR